MWDLIASNIIRFFPPSKTNGTLELLNKTRFYRFVDMKVLWKMMIGKRKVCPGSENSAPYLLKWVESGVFDQSETPRPLLLPSAVACSNWWCSDILWCRASWAQDRLLFQHLMWIVCSWPLFLSNDSSSPSFWLRQIRISSFYRQTSVPKPS